MFSLNFWFSLHPSPLFPSSETILLCIFSLFIVGSIILKVLVTKFNLHLQQRITNLYRMFLIMGIIGLFLLFFSFERAYLIGARFWFLCWTLGFLVWLGFILYDIFKKMPKEKENLKTKESFEKYLPKPKKSHT